MNISEARRSLGSGKPKVVKLWSQRAEPLPWLNCRYWGFLSQLWWSGLRWRGGRETALGLTELLRRKSGRPEFIDGEAQGSTSADLDRALREVFPWIRPTHRMVPDDELLDGLGRVFTAGIAVWLPDLPARQQRFAGGGRIGHYVGLYRSRQAPVEVLVLDPLGHGDYGGDWMRFADLRPALMQRGSGSTFCTLVEVGDAMLTVVEPIKAFAGGGATATLPKGTYRTFRVRTSGKQADFEPLRPVTLAGKRDIRIGYVAEVSKLPSARKPQGRFVFVTDGPDGLRGQFMRRGDVDLVPPQDPGLPGDIDALLAAARLEGFQEAERQFALVELPDELFEKVAS